MQAYSKRTDWEPAVKSTASTKIHRLKRGLPRSLRSLAMTQSLFIMRKRKHGRLKLRERLTKYVSLEIATSLRSSQ